MLDLSASRTTWRNSFDALLQDSEAICSEIVVASSMNVFASAYRGWVEPNSTQLQIAAYTTLVSALVVTNGQRLDVQGLCFDAFGPLFLLGTDSVDCIIPDVLEDGQRLGYEHPA